MTETLQRINAAAENLYDHLSTREDIPMVDTLLNSMERINVVAELLYDLLYDNPRAQVLAEIIMESSDLQVERQNHCD